MSEKLSPHKADRKAIKELEKELRTLVVNSPRFREVRMELARRKIQYREKYFNGGSFSEIILQSRWLRLISSQGKYIIQVRHRRFFWKMYRWYNVTFGTFNYPFRTGSDAFSELQQAKDCYHDCLAQPRSYALSGTHLSSLF